MKTRTKLLSIVVLCFIGISMLSILPRQAKSDTSGLVGYWKFDEGSSNTAYDSSGSANTGTLHGPQWVEGKIGKALEFNGISDYVSIPNSPSLNIIGNQISVEFWMKLPNGWHAGSGSYDQILYDKGDAYTSAMIAGDGCLRFNIPYLPPYPETNKNSWEANVWYHIGEVFDGNQIRIYINGVLDKEETVVGSVSTSSIQLAIGSHCYGDSNFFNGAIDDFAIYNLARTSEDILNDYNAGQNAQSSVWMQWWFWTIVALGAIVVVLAFTTVHYHKKPSVSKENSVTQSKTTLRTNRVCPKCGANLPADSKFCGKCGTSLE